LNGKKNKAHGFGLFFAILFFENSEPLRKDTGPMIKVSILLAALMLVFPMAASADTQNGRLRTDFRISNDYLWQELLNNADTYRLTCPLDAVPYIQLPRVDRLEMGMGADVAAVACLPPQIPEPTTIILLGAGLAGLGLGNKRRR
jgi:hypothetical protein